MSVCVWVWVFVCVREREREGCMFACEKERERDKKRWHTQQHTWADVHNCLLHCICRRVFTLSKMPNYFEGKKESLFFLPYIVIPHDGLTMFTPNRPQSLVPSNFKRTKKLTLGLWSPGVKGFETCRKRNQKLVNYQFLQFSQNQLVQLSLAW